MPSFCHFYQTLCNGHIFTFSQYALNVIQFKIICIFLSFLAEFLGQIIWNISKNGLAYKAVSSGFPKQCATWKSLESVPNVMVQNCQSQRDKTFESPKLRLPVYLENEIYCTVYRMCTKNETFLDIFSETWKMGFQSWDHHVSQRSSLWPDEPENCAPTFSCNTNP